LQRYSPRSTSPDVPPIRPSLLMEIPGSAFTTFTKPGNASFSLYPPLSEAFLFSICLLMPSQDMGNRLGVRFAPQTPPRGVLNFFFPPPAPLFSASLLSSQKVDRPSSSAPPMEVNVFSCMHFYPFFVARSLPPSNLFRVRRPPKSQWTTTWWSTPPPPPPFPPFLHSPTSPHASAFSPFPPGVAFFYIGLHH